MRTKKILIATNNIPDILSVSSSDLNEYGRTGVFLDITKYLDQMPNFKKVIQDNPEIKRLYVDGKLYGFPVAVQNNIQLGKALVMRSDILKKLNLAPPKTFDELYTVLKKMKEAYPESTPWSARGMGSFLDAVSLGMGSGYGLYYDPDVKGGSYVYGTSKPEFKEVLAYLNKLYSEKILDPDFSVNTQQKWAEKMSSGKAFFYYDNNSFALNYNDALKQSDSEAKLEVMPYLQNSKGKTRGFLYARGWLADNYAVSSKVKDPVAVIKMFDWLYSPEGAETSNFGKKGETYEIVNGQPKMLDSLIAKYKTSADPLRAMQSEVGAGLLAISPLVDERPNAQISSPDLVRWSDQLKKDPGAYVIPGIGPSLTKEESDKVKQIRTKMDPLEQDVVKFIMGAKPLTEFDKFAESLNAAGAPELEKIYNDALARTK
ncbi:extracellular solute-binding protein [Paenibacillus sp. CC-CFT747]|nr:extracellular solute-binding protein [Paenibacillus sp. CC-CFT747]